MAAAGTGDVQSAPETPFETAVGSAKAAMMSDPGVALSEARRAATLASTSHDAKLAVATSQWLESEALTRLNHPDDAMKLIDKALAFVAKERAGTKLHADLLRTRANVSIQSGNVQLGLASLLKAHGIYTRLGEARSRAMVLQNLGTIYDNAHDYPRALDYYAQAADAYTDDPALTLSAHNNRGNIFKNAGDFTSAEAEYKIALDIAKTMDSPLLEARIKTNIASALLLQGHPRKADALARSTLAAATGDAAQWAPYLWGVRGQAAHALGDDAAAVRYFERTFDGVDLKTSSMVYREYHEAARYAYERLGLDHQALQHLEAFKRLDDQARDVTATTLSALMSSRFDAANQKVRIAQLKVEKAQSDQRLRNTVMLAVAGILGALSIIIAVLFAYVSARRSRRETAAANAMLTYTARHDALTTLANRAYFREQLGEALVRAEPSALVLIDLDRFKAINDNFGHSAGDELLRQVAERIQASVGSQSLPARLGGDEFAVLVPFTDKRLITLADDIVTALGKPFTLECGVASIGASLGIAIAPVDGDTVDHITRSADLALYRSKATGRNRHMRFEPWMQEEAEDRRRLEEDLRSALVRDEFAIVYQPIVNALTGNVAAYEALLRWQHPTRGDVSPEVFVPIAEEARLINEIGGWVLRTACQAAAGWEGDIKVAVNLSALQIEGEGLVPTIVNALAQTGLAAERLELEMTESIFLRQGARTEQTLDQLRSLGVSLALDDFGKGYSSLGYLQRASFSKIKIDRSFVQSATDGCPESVAIIKAIVALAQSLRMDTTAEGIERGEETAMMRELGCTQLQGFLFGRPDGVAGPATKEPEAKRA
jgi:diguanylate cyclase (GGDEF)-like protein